MKKIFCLTLVLFTGILVLSATGDFPFEFKEFTVNTYRNASMIQVKNIKTPDVDTHYAFTNKAKTYQVRYSFFTQTIPGISREDIIAPYSSCVLMTLLNMAGGEEGIANPRDFPDSAVKSEFNGDFGTTTVIRDPKSDYAKGFQFIVVNFFYKQDQGIVVQAILFNDINFVQTDEYAKAMNSFKFQD
jgi:hypothetical protein